MTTESAFSLTAKDHAILETMLERDRGGCPEFSALLRRKLNEGRVYLRDDIPADVATLNSRVSYRADGRDMGVRLLVQADATELPGFALSIHRLAGLALLGLSSGGRLYVEGQAIELVAVVAQPEAGASAAMAASVLRFPVRSATGQRSRGGFDDDPGPQAA